MCMCAWRGSWVSAGVVTAVVAVPVSPLVGVDTNPCRAATASGAVVVIVDRVVVAVVDAVVADGPSDEIFHPCQDQRKVTSVPLTRVLNQVEMMDDVGMEKVHFSSTHALFVRLVVGQSSFSVSRFLFRCWCSCWC